MISPAALAGDADLSAAPDDLDAQAVSTIRMLAADMVEAAASGHPGMPLGCAPMAWVLWSRHLKHDPTCPTWTDRDRFVLSAGHGSALLYALLHLFGYGLTVDDLRQFRQLGSLTPGHPEHGHTIGVETTTGPLGQGLANAVGMALAERMLNARFGGHVDHYTYALVGDGCLMEGISHEAASLAGQLRLGRLVVLYDDNDITIDGPAAQSCADDVEGRFSAYGWHTIRVRDGNDLDEIDAALVIAKADARPSLLVVPTVIGYGAPGVEGTSKAHGSPLGTHTMAATRLRFGWPADAFDVARDVTDHVAAITSVGTARRQAWDRSFNDWCLRRPDLADAWASAHTREPTQQLLNALESVPHEPVATRQASAQVLAAIGASMPELVGGSADLAGSTGTDALPGAVVSAKDYAGSTLHFGIREHGMAAVLNGMALHGGLRPFGSTFLVFSDYLRPALRLSALMRLPVVYVLTHDSVAVGEDGPTHQPVEHLESLRLIPDLAVLRPADAAETVSAWHAALTRTDGPTALVLSRQALPDLGDCDVDLVARYGARIVGRAVSTPRVTILATGSEAGLACEAATALGAEGVDTRVVSVPWRERFAALGDDARAAIIGDPEITVAVEAGVPDGWVAWTGAHDRVVGVAGFGASGPGAQVLEHFGLTSAAVADLVRRELAQQRADTRHA